MSTGKNLDDQTESQESESSSQMDKLVETTVADFLNRSDDIADLTTFDDSKIGDEIGDIEWAFDETSSTNTRSAVSTQGEMLQSELPFGYGSESIISSFDDLLEAISVEADGIPESYRIIGKDSEIRVRSESSRMQLDYLPLFAAKQEVPVVYSNPSIKAFRKLCSEVGLSEYSNNGSLRVLDDVSILSCSHYLKSDSDSLILPYGAKRPFCLDSRDSFLNPLISELVVDVYSREISGYSRSEINLIFSRNSMLTFVPSGNDEEGLWENVINYLEDDFILHSDIPFSSPSSSDERAIFNLCASAKSIFLSTVLPLALLDNNFKSYAGFSPLYIDKIGLPQFKKIRAAFIYFLCGIRQFADYVNIKSFAIESYDSKAIFEGKYTSLAIRKKEKPKPIPEEINATIKSQFALNGSSHEDVTLTGLSVSDDSLQSFSDLCEKHPHFKPVFDYLMPFVEASFSTGRPLTFPPMLIAGPPGIGKTKFISELFEVFGYPISHCHASQFTCGSALAGLQSTWSNAQPGYVSEAMRRSKLYNPLIAFDELERIRMASSGGNGISVEAALMRLLEPLEAKRFVDACGQMPHDVSKVNWIFTCNDPSSIPAPLLTRLNKVFVYPPIKDEIVDAIHKDIWTDLVNQFAKGGFIKPWISEDALEKLRDIYYGDLNFRATIKVLRKALSQLLAGTMGVNYITLEVLEDKPAKILYN